jgi:hypothetical protein
METRALLMLDRQSTAELYQPLEMSGFMKKNEMLSFAGKWMELENIILSEVSLAQKTKNRMFSLICGHSIKGKHNNGIGL